MDPSVEERLARLARVAEALEPPCAIVDLPAFDANGVLMASQAGGLPIRVATKSIRSRALIRRALASSRAFAGLLAYSAREACHLVDDGFDDVLVAYPTAELAEIEAVAARVAEGKIVVLAVDSADAVDRCARVATTVGVTLPLCIDLDCATRFPGLLFGVRRSPLDTPADVVALAATIAREPGVRLDGVLGYEAQIAGVRDRLPLDRAKARLMRALKRRSLADVVERRGAIVDALRARFPLRFVNGGGTGSLDVSRRDPSLTELAAGSGFFAPALFDGYDGLPLEPAAFFALSVSRVHDATTVVTSGGGYVASGPAGADRLPVPVFPPRGELMQHEGAGEVQTPVRFPRALRPALGGRVLFRHAKAGELGERFDSYHLVQGERVVESVTTYRGDGVTFF